MKRNQNPWGVCLLMTAIAAAGMLFCVRPVRGQAPNLVVSASGSQLGVSSDSRSTWKQFTVTGGSAGVYNVLWAESSGTAGGIYTATLTVSAAVAVSPSIVPTPADTLPIGALTASVSAAAAGIDAATLGAAAATYETLAKEVDAGAIVTPVQLYLSMGVQTLGLSDAQRTAATPLMAAVKTWLNQQQTAGKLDDTKMPDYARALHAVAKTLSGGYTIAPAAPHLMEPAIAPNSPCANGKCPLPAQEPAAGFRRRR